MNKEDKEIAELETKCQLIQDKLDHKVEMLQNKYSYKNNTKLEHLKEQLNTLEESLNFITTYPFTAFTINALAIEDEKHDKDIESCVQVQKLIGALIDADSTELIEELNKSELNKETFIN